jgi:hypothetical protein
LGQDVYAQQYQMARFFGTAYPGKSIAFNDIGLQAWFDQNAIVDLVGLSDGEVARKRLGRDWNSEVIGTHVAGMGAEVAAVYPSWFAPYGGLPSSWHPVGALQLAPGIQVNVAGLQVIFYGTNPEAAQRLSQRLKDFAPQLPENAKFQSFY